MKKVINALLCLAMLLNLCAVSAFAADGEALSFYTRGDAANISSGTDDDGYYTYTMNNVDSYNTYHNLSYYARMGKTFYSSDESPAYVALSEHIKITDKNVSGLQFLPRKGSGEYATRVNLITITEGEHDITAIWDRKAKTIKYWLDGAAMPDQSSDITEFAGLTTWQSGKTDGEAGVEMVKVKGIYKTYDESYNDSLILLDLSDGAVAVTPVSRNTGYVRVSSKQADGSYVMTSGAQNTTDMQYPQYSYNVLTDKVFTANDGVKYVAVKVHAKPTDLIKGQAVQLGGIYDVSLADSNARYTATKSSYVYTADEEHDIFAIYDAKNSTITVYYNGIATVTYSEVPSFNGFFIYRWFDKSTIAEGDEFETVTASAKAYTEGTLTDVLNEYLPEKQSLTYTVSSATANGDGSYSFTRSNTSTDTTNATFKLSSPVSVYTEGTTTEKYVAYKFTLTPKVRTDTAQIMFRFTTSANSYDYSSTIKDTLPNISAIDKPYEVVAVWDLVNNNDTFYVNGVKIGSGAPNGKIDNIQILRVMMSGASVVDTFDISDVSATVYRGSYDLDKIASELIPGGVSDFGLNFAEISDGVLKYEYFGNLSKNTVFAAGYDSEGELSGFYGTNSTNKNYKIQGSMEVDDAKAIKLFIWNMDTIEPLMSATTVR
jgi:hypothetical protein